jgi:regulator of sirC expression with transglutaminase-like and TPR domain
MNDQPVASLLRFVAFARQPEERLGLAEGALLVAEAAYPTLDQHRYRRHLDTLAAAVRPELGLARGATLPAEQLRVRETAERVCLALREVLAGREGFHGNQEEYYHPRNSFLNEVLESKTGLPITLCIVYIEVARRLGAPLVGVGLPAHFLAKWPLSPDEGDDLFVDAFNGTLLDLDECREFAQRLTSASRAAAHIDPEWLEPASNRSVLTRLLHNLKHAYLQRGETAAALDMVERLVILRPDLPEELRDRGLLRLALGEVLLAAADIAAYAQRVPAAPEVRRLCKRMAAIGEVQSKLN